MAFSGTVGNGDLLYLPPGMLFAEHTTGACFGFKFAVLPKLDKVAEGLRKLATALGEAGQMSEKEAQLDFAWVSVALVVIAIRCCLRVASAGRQVERTMPDI